MHRLKSSQDYFLLVVKKDEEPKWSASEEDLVVGHQPLDSNYVQYWAYHKNSGLKASDLPNAEVVASQNHTKEAIILVDQPEHLKDESDDNVELILVKDGHAWGKVPSSVANLEDNLSAVLEFAKDQFNINVEHFMTTDKVSKEVENTLNNLEEKEEEKNNPPETEQHPGIRQVNTGTFAIGFGGGGAVRSSAQNFQNRRLATSGKSTSKLIMIIPVVVILIAFASAALFKDKIFAVLGKTQKTVATVAVVTPTPSPTATPTPTEAPFDRSSASVRILNGTDKSGAAGALGKDLEKLGWKVAGTGNAPKKGVLQTEVRAKEGSESAAEALVKDLSSNYKATISANLKDTDKADVEIIIGKE